MEKAGEAGNLDTLKNLMAKLEMEFDKFRLRAGK
jgi:hypothetical protein